jgi:ACS family sodium-dependent inorganic phosphate cotransporter-like MFS transporter 5
MWAIIIVHCGQNWGFWMLLTEMPTYMSEIVGFSIKEVSLKAFI